MPASIQDLRHPLYTIVDLQFTAARRNPFSVQRPGSFTPVNMTHRRGAIALRTLLCRAGLLALSLVQTNNAADSSTNRSSNGTSADPNPQAGDQHDDPIDCRVAVCISGHIRSFVYPVVHRSIRTNLIEAIEKEGRCKVDVFAYATPSDVVASYKLVRA